MSSEKREGRFGNDLDYRDTGEPIPGSLSRVIGLVHERTVMGLSEAAPERLQGDAFSYQLWSVDRYLQLLERIADGVDYHRKVIQSLMNLGRAYFSDLILYPKFMQVGELAQSREKAIELIFQTVEIAGHRGMLLRNLTVLMYMGRVEAIMPELKRRASIVRSARRGSSSRARRSCMWTAYRRRAIRFQALRLKFEFE